MSSKKPKTELEQAERQRVEALEAESAWRGVDEITRETLGRKFQESGNPDDAAAIETHKAVSKRMKAWHADRVKAAEARLSAAKSSTTRQEIADALSAAVAPWPPESDRARTGLPSLALLVEQQEKRKLRHEAVRSAHGRDSEACDQLLDAAAGRVLEECGLGSRTRDAALVVQRTRAGRVVQRTRAGRVGLGRAPKLEAFLLLVDECTRVLAEPLPPDAPKLIEALLKESAALARPIRVPRAADEASASEVKRTKREAADRDSRLAADRAAADALQEVSPMSDLIKSPICPKVKQELAAWNDEHGNPFYRETPQKWFLIKLEEDPDDKALRELSDRWTKMEREYRAEIPDIAEECEALVFGKELEDKTPPRWSRDWCVLELRRRHKSPAHFELWCMYARNIRGILNGEIDPDEIGYAELKFRPYLDFGS